MIKTIIAALTLFTLSYATTMGPNPILVNTLAPIGTPFVNAWGVTTDSSGLLYVSNRNVSRINLFYPDDSVYSTASFGTTTWGCGVAVDSNNYIYLGQPGAGYTSIWNPKPSFSSYGTIPLIGGGTIQYDNKNNLFYILTTSANIYNNNGIITNPLNHSLSSFAFNSGGGGGSMTNYTSNSNYYISTNNGIVGTIEVRSPYPNYSYLATYGAGWSSPLAIISAGLDIEPISGNLYIIDYSNNRLVSSTNLGVYQNAFINASGFNFNGPSSIKLVNSTGKIYITNQSSANLVSILFDPFSWTAPGTSYLATLPLNQALTLNTGYNLTMTINAGFTGSTSSGGSAVGPVQLNPNAILTLAGGILTPDATQGITLASGTLVDQANSTISTPMNVTAASTVTSRAGNTLRLSGAMTITNPLTFNGPGTTVLSGVNSGVGGVTIASGSTVGLGSNTALGTSTLFLNPNTTIQATNSTTNANTINFTNGIGNVDTYGNSLTLNGSTIINGTLNKIGLGTLIMAGVGSGSGGVTVSNGTLAIGSNTALGNVAIAMNGGIIQAAGNISIPNMITGNTPFTMDTQSNTLTHTGNLMGNNTLTKVGSGTLVMSGSNNYAGSINISSGAITLGTNEIWGSVQGSGTLNLGNYLFFVGKDNTNQTFSGKLTGSNLIHKQGTGIITFTGDLSGFTGTISIDGGEVIINSSTAFNGKIVNNTGASVNTKNNTVINGDFVSSGVFIVG
jgi:autotransporter-associated beta strand protein